MLIFRWLQANVGAELQFFIQQREKNGGKMVLVTILLMMKGFSRFVKVITILWDVRNFVTVIAVGEWTVK